MTDNLQLSGNLKNKTLDTVSWGAGIRNLKFDFALNVNGREKVKRIWNKKIEEYSLDTWVDIKLNFNTYNLKKTNKLSVVLKNIYVFNKAANWRRSIAPPLEAVNITESRVILGSYIQNVKSYDLNSVNLHLQYKTDNYTKVHFRTISHYINLIIDAIYKAAFDIQTHYIAYESYQKNIYTNKIYMTSYELANHNLKIS